jgi:hypothetical protein
MCVATLCFGEVYATILGKPHSEIFDATLGSLLGYFIGRSVRPSKPEAPKPEDPKPPQ